MALDMLTIHANRKSIKQHAYERIKKMKQKNKSLSQMNKEKRN